MGRAEVRGDRLFVGDRDRTWAVEQTYREALAVQVALASELNSQRITVTPIICAIGGVTGNGRVIGGVEISGGKGLARLIQERPAVFDDDTVQRLARLADERLREQHAWDRV